MPAKTPRNLLSTIAPALLDYHGGNVFLFNRAAQNEEAFRRSVEGMRSLLRSSHAMSADSEVWPRLINGIYPTGEPAPGQTIKVVQ